MEVIAAMNGAAIGIFGMFAIGLIAIAMMRATITTKRTINELKERKGDVVAPPLETGTVSPVLLFGLILNACALSLRNSGSVSDYIVTAVQILAIVAMLTGIYQSRDVFRK